MEDTFERDNIEELRTWLSNRRQSSDSIDHYQRSAIIHPNEPFSRLQFPDLHLDCFSLSSTKHAPTNLSTQPVSKFDLNQLLKWLTQLLDLLRANKACLETIESIRDPINKRLASYRVQEALNLIQSALLMQTALDVRLDGLDCVTIEEPTVAIQDLMRDICLCLFTRNSVLVIAKTSDYPSCLLAAFLVELMHQAGASKRQVQLYVKDNRPRDSIEQPAFNWTMSSANPMPAKRASVSICFGDVSTIQVTKYILETYQRQVECPNHIVLVEESVYDRFVTNWQYNYQKLQKHEATDFQVDLNSIDIKAAYRMSGACINVIKFRSVDELFKLINKLRKLQRIQLWTNDHLLARELCISPRNSSSQPLNQCNEFWLNHLPLSSIGRRFNEDLLQYYRNSMKEHMNEVYTNVFYDYESDIELLRRMQASFVNKKSSAIRVQQVLKTYLNLISKCKSMKQMTCSISESVIKLKKFQVTWLNSISELPGESRIETSLRPVGIALLVIRKDNCVKSKSVIIEFIFKNLILGNGVLLICPQSLLGSRFPMDLMKQHNLPFQMIDLKASQQANYEPLLESSPIGDQNSSWSSFDSSLSASFLERKPLKCPKGIYALEYRELDLTSEKVETNVIALGSKRRSIWIADGLLHHSQFSGLEESF